MKQFVRKPLALMLALLLGLTGCSASGLEQLATAMGDAAALMSELDAALQEDETTEDADNTGDADVADDADNSEMLEPSDAAETPEDTAETPPADQPVYGQDYTAPEAVAAYLHCYQELPPNFLTKDEARDLGWDNSAGNLQEVAPGKSIGGDDFGNREGLLPDGDWHECDVNYFGGYRGAERLVWSDEGAIYYTADHYESFTQLYEGWAS